MKKKKKMSPVMTVYVPCFSSQPGSSQRDGTDLIMEEQPEAPRQDKRGKVRGVKTRSVLKVKLPTVNKKGTEEDKTRRRRTTEPASKKTRTTESRGGGAQYDDRSRRAAGSFYWSPSRCSMDTSGVGTDSDAVVGDAFSFPERPASKAINEKEKAKLAVLRTISKVLEENQLIRQRLSVLSQTS